jgi:hypothetical protein
VRRVDGQGFRLDQVLGRGDGGVHVRGDATVHDRLQRALEDANRRRGCVRLLVEHPQVFVDVDQALDQRDDVVRIRKLGEQVGHRLLREFGPGPGVGQDVADRLHRRGGVVLRPDVRLGGGDFAIDLVERCLANRLLLRGVGGKFLRLLKSLVRRRECLFRGRQIAHRRDCRLEDRPILGADRGKDAAAGGEAVEG